MKTKSKDSGVPMDYDPSRFPAFAVTVDVVILTMSEFGRTVAENGSGGTDHGHANCMFVLGGSVSGGKVHGQWPGLAPEQLYQGRDLAVTTDFRDIFAELTARHLGASHLERIFPGYDPDPKSWRGLLA